MLRRSGVAHQGISDGSVGGALGWDRAKRVASAVCTDETALNPSVIPTRHFQRSLPRLPIPLLGNSLVRYTAAVKPLVPPSQYDKTVKAVREFEMKDGAALQDELVRTDRANRHTSFISSDYFERVLKKRDPVPMRRSRTLLVRSPDPSPTQSVDMLTRATLWVRSSVLYYKAYLDNTLYPDVRYIPDDAKAYYQQDWFERTIALCPEYVSSPFMALTSGHHAFPLDMSQHDNLFNSTRAPGVLQDEVRAVGFMPHIVVQYRGRQFAVTVADEDSNPLPEDQIYARLRAVVTSPAASSPPRVDMGVFTTLPRTEWNGVRTSLLRHTKNQKSLETLDSSMFVLNLDDEVQEDFFQRPKEAMTRGIAKAGNRWWDKSFSVNVDAQGSLSVSYEESWGDGAAVRRYVEDVFQHSMRRMQGGTQVVDSSKATEAVRELQWTLTPELEQMAAKAKRRYQQDVDRLDVSVGVVDGFRSGGAEDGAALRGTGASSVPAGERGGSPSLSVRSPSATSTGAESGVLQLAMQLAWWRLNSAPVAAIEPVAMNAFRRGRVDSVFPSTTESQAFVLLMTTGTSSDADKRALCLRALGVYEDAKKAVAAGAGIVAHFTALRTAAHRIHGRTSTLFSDPSYRLLSSPQLVAVPESAPSLRAVTSTPVKNGYGVTYTTLTHPSSKEQSMVLSVTAWNGVDGPRHAAADFTAAVAEAASDIRRLLASGKE